MRRLNAMYNSECLADASRTFQPHAVATALATGHHLRTIQMIAENVCLVSWAAAPSI